MTLSFPLSMAERLILPELFQESGDFITVGLMRDIEQKTKVSQEEIKKIGLKVNEDKTLSWDPNKEDKNFSISLSDAEVRFLKGRVSFLEEEKKITLRNFDLFLKIKEIDLTKKQDATKVETPENEKK